MRWPSAQVRETFIQYFVRHPTLPHLHVPSSSIIPPRKDPTLAFVNAGMNQFKDAILGLGRPPNPRVTNSQKCLRINDLSLVGVDTFHHTFFEMMGNWSFNDYFKTEACEMAWDLLTNVYKLDPQRLYVTYYANDNNNNGVPTDEETRRIWEGIGIPPTRLLPFGKENFWAMGPVGPCGPSTEIHYDHRGTVTEPSEVNGDSGLVVEVWNLVFMQYNRTSPTAPLERLPLSHVVDTGAGLERLTAVLNGQSSNYNTDLFEPIFECVRKLSNAPKYTDTFNNSNELDQSYRILADHLRAVTVALADGVLPQGSHKIRKLIQKILSITEKDFLPHLKSSREISSFLKECIATVASTISKVYPETVHMQEEMGDILSIEIDRFLEAGRQTPSDGKGQLPSLLLMDFPSLGKIKKDDLASVISSGELDARTAFKWCDTHGTTPSALEELSSTLSLRFSRQSLLEEMQRVKKSVSLDVATNQLFNSQTAFTRKVEAHLSPFNPQRYGRLCQSTVDKDQKICVEFIFDQDGDPIEEIKTSGPSNTSRKYWVLLTKTPFVPGGPHVASDKGTICLQDGSILDVVDVVSLPSGWVLHHVENLPSSGFHRHTPITTFTLNTALTFGRELSAKTIRHLQHWLYKTYKIVRFTDGFVSEDQVRLSFTLLAGKELNQQEIRDMEADLNEYGVPVVVINKVSRKAGEFELVCATGIAAEAARRNGEEAGGLLKELAEAGGSGDAHSIASELTRCLRDPTIVFPYTTTREIKQALEKLDKAAGKSETFADIQRISDDISSTAEDVPYFIKSYPSDAVFTSLKKLTRIIELKGKPVLILIQSSDDFVQGRCVAGNKGTTPPLSASTWLTRVASELGIPLGNVHPPKGQDPHLVVNLKRTRVPNSSTKMVKALQVGEEYVAQCFDKMDKSRKEEEQ